MSYAPHRLGRHAAPALIVCMLLSGACLSSKSNNGNASNAARPAVATGAATTTGVAATADAGTAAAATIVSQAQPGATGTLMTGVIALNGDAPPPGSTLYLGLVSSPNDNNPRTCIDADRNPVNAVGQFYAQVACSPKTGDQLLYVLILGDPGARDWHRGVIALPPNLRDFRIDAS